MCCRSKTSLVQIRGLLLCVPASPAATAYVGPCCTTQHLKALELQASLHNCTHSTFTNVLLLFVTCRHLISTYGPGWQVPDASYHGVTQKAPDWWPIQQALLTRLAATAWGDMTWPERRSRCDASKSAATPTADAVAAKEQKSPAAAEVEGPGAGTQQQRGRQQQQPQEEQADEAGLLLKASSDSAWSADVTTSTTAGAEEDAAIVAQAAAASEQQ